MELNQTVIILLLIIVILLLVIKGFLLYFFFIKKSTPATPFQPPQEEPKKEVKAPTPESNQNALSYCEIHDKEHASGLCGICEKPFCEECLKEHDGLYFCPEHFKLYLSNEWKTITNIRTTPDTPEEGVFVYEMKRETWNDKGLPSFIVTHYKIDVASDAIESYVQLNVLEKDQPYFDAVMAKKKGS